MFDANIATNKPKLSWKNYDNSETPAFLSILDNSALTCSDSNISSDPIIRPNDWFPRPYGVPAAPILSGATKFKVSTTNQEVNWPTTFPTNFVIGD